MAKQKTFHDPNTYLEMSKPFDTQKEAADAIDAFFVDLQEIRKKHRIPDIQLVAGISWQGEESVSDYLLQAGLGDEFKAEAMMAFGLGQVQAQRQQRIASLLRAGGSIMRQQE